MDENLNDSINLMTSDIESIEYKDIVEFCNQKIEEDIDLDYKSAFPNDLDRLLSAFANTQGGLVIIGIEEEGKTRKPKCPPKGVDGDEDVLRQKILNISFDSIYPPIEPEVAIVKDPKRNKSVVLVRVNPSRQLHSVNRRRRIYIRSSDNNRGFELASLPDLRWLWDQREATVALRTSIVERAETRANSDAIKFPEDGGKELWNYSPHLKISMVPAYPSLPFIESTRTLLDIVGGLIQTKSDWPFVDTKVPWSEHYWRTNPSSVCLMDRGRKATAQYIEFGIFGHVYFDFQIRRKHVSSLTFPKNTNEECVFAFAILANVNIALRHAISFYEAIQFRLPILVSIEIEGVSNLLLQYHNPSKRNILDHEYLSRPSTDNQITLLNEETNADRLSDKQHEHYNSCAQKLIWAFGIAWNEDEISNWFGHS